MTSQERSKERLYEERIELKWEKGGSGLVFYTDAQYWQEEEGGTQQKQSCRFTHFARESLYIYLFKYMIRCLYLKKHMSRYLIHVNISQPG